jgi:hypothetical protein
MTEEQVKVMGEQLKAATPSDEAWGVYCQHGIHIVKADPERVQPNGHPVGRIVEPWPCTADGCTREAFEREMEEEEGEYRAEQWREYMNLIS